MSRHGTQEPANDTCINQKRAVTNSGSREFTGRQHPIHRARKMPMGQYLVKGL
jgi:hypothetical protein